MKKLFVVILSIATFFSCDKIKETKKAVTDAKDAVSEVSDAVENLGDLEENINEMQEDMERLKEATPLTNEELKAWLPDEVNGLKRTGYKAGQASYMKIASIEGTFKDTEKNKEFTITILDGAGEMGAAATAGVKFMFAQDFEEEDENKLRRTTTKNGVKMIEEYRKSNNRSEVQFFHDNRFFVTVKGRNMDLDETHEAIKDLDLEDLN